VVGGIAIAMVNDVWWYLERRGEGREDH